MRTEIRKIGNLVRSETLTDNKTIDGTGKVVVKSGTSALTVAANATLTCGTMKVESDEDFSKINADASGKVSISESGITAKMGTSDYLNRYWSSSEAAANRSGSHVRAIASNESKMTVTVEDGLIKLSGKLDELTGYFSEGGGQNDREKKWIAVLSNTGMENLTGVKFSGNIANLGNSAYSLDNDGERGEARSYGSIDDKEFVLWLKADDLAGTRKTAYLSYEDGTVKSFTYTIVDTSPKE